MLFLKQSTASQEVMLGPFVDDTDGKTAETALSIANTDIKIWVEGATTEFNKTSGGATHIASGRYYCVLDATDTATLGKMEINVHVAGALPVRREFMVLPANIYDSIVSGTDVLDVSVTQLLGTAWLTPGTAGTPDVNVRLISGDSTAADNAEAFFDGTGYAGTNNVIPTVTTVTTATNVTTVNGLAANVITAASMNADASVEVAAAVWDRVLNAANHNIASSAGRRLRQLDASSIISGTAAAGASNSITLDGSASATDDIYDENLIVITGGTGAGQTRVIVEYNGTTKVAIVNRVWQTNPSTDSTYDIIAGAQADIVQHGLAQGGTASTITLASTASATDDIYLGNHIYISTSTGSGQTRLITDYNGTTKVATVSPDWVTNPTSSSVYKIIPIGRSVVDSGTITTATNVTTVNGLANNVITAASIAADAITDAKVASDVTIASVTGAVGSVTAGVTVATISANVITASALATDAVAEIADGVWDEATSGHTTAGTTGKALTDASSAGNPWAALTASNTDAGSFGLALGTTIQTTLASRASQTSVDDLPTNAELATALGTADDATLAAIAAEAIKTSAIQAKTDLIPASPASTTNITAGTITTVTNLTNAPTSGDLTSTMKASVNAEVLDVLNVDTFAELSAPPAATSSLRDKLTWLFMWARNKATATSSQRKLYADDGTTVVSTEALSDDSTTYTKGEAS